MIEMRIASPDTNKEGSNELCSRLLCLRLACRRSLRCKTRLVTKYYCHHLSQEGGKRVTVQSSGVYLRCGCQYESRFVTTPSHSWFAASFSLCVFVKFSAPIWPSSTVHRLWPREWTINMPVLWLLSHGLFERRINDDDEGLLWGIEGALSRFERKSGIEDRNIRVGRWGTIEES